MMRAGIYKAVTMKTLESQRIRSLLTARKMLRTKSTDMENTIQSLLLTFGLKLNRGGASTFERRVQALVGADDFLSRMIEPLLVARRQTLEAMQAFEERLTHLAQDDPVCRAPHDGFRARGRSWL